MKEFSFSLGSGLEPVKLLKLNLFTVPFQVGIFYCSGKCTAFLAQNWMECIRHVVRMYKTFVTKDLHLKISAPFIITIAYHSLYIFESTIVILKTFGMRSSIKYVRKIFRKTSISNPLIRIRTSAYVLNGWPLYCF